MDTLYKNQKLIKIANHFREILKELEVWDSNDDNLTGTPDRVARYLIEFLHEWDGGNSDSLFESIQVDQLVIVKNIPFWSLCSHHCLPFHGEVSVGYLSGSKVIGLSKIPRIIQKHAHKLQLQEKLAHDIANNLEEVLGDARGIMVLVKAEHSCMSMRGIRSEGQMITSVLKGAFSEDYALRQEFLSLVKS